MRDVTDLGRHARLRDDELARASRDVRVHVDHVGAVAEGDVGARHDLDRLRDRQALAGQRGLRDLEGRRFEQAAVRRHEVAGFDRDQVARHELLRSDLVQRAVAQYACLDDHHLLQRGDRRGGLPFLVHAEDGVEQGEEEQDEPGPELLQRVEAPDRRDEQHDLHRVAVLAHEGLPLRLPLRLGEPVRPVLRAPLRHLGRGQALQRVRVELGDDVVRLERVPAVAVPLALG